MRRILLYSHFKFDSAQGDSGSDSRNPPQISMLYKKVKENNRTAEQPQMPIAPVVEQRPEGEQ